MGLSLQTPTAINCSPVFIVLARENSSVGIVFRSVGSYNFLQKLYGFTPVYVVPLHVRNFEWVA